MRSALNAALGGLLAASAASATTGCCEVLHLGWARSVGPRSWRELRPMAPALVAAATIDEVGYYDGDTCEQACRAGSDVDIDGCYPVAVAASVASSRSVLCRFEKYPYDEMVTVPAAELAAVPLGAFDLLAQPYCEHTCVRGTDPVKECKLVVATTPPPRPDQPFVVCELYRGSHCAGPSLSRGSCQQPGL